MSVKVWCAFVRLDLSEGTVVSEADFSTAGVVAVRARCMRLKWCWLTRYDAMDDLPAQMPERSIAEG
jgi:hypothetical protein